MSVSILLITHAGIAENLLITAKEMLGSLSTQVKALEVPFDAPVDSIKAQAKTHITDINQGDGILILTDLYGSTPSNIGCELLEIPDTKMVAGINLPMLIRVLNYPELSLEALTLKAESGGKDGILQCTCKTRT